MNIPGILKIEKIEADKVSLPILKSGDYIQLENYTTENLQEIDFITESPGIKITKNKQAAGSYSEIEIPFTIAGYSSDTIKDLDFTSRKPHIFKVTEKTGMVYMIGFDRNPKASFTFDINNDPSPKGGRSVKCKISWSTTVFPVNIGTEPGGGIPT